MTEPARTSTEPRTLRVATYTQEEVLALFQMSRKTIYRKPHLMACRVSESPVRYSRERIDAILSGTLPMPARRTSSRRRAS